MNSRDCLDAKRKVVTSKTLFFFIRKNDIFYAQNPPKNCRVTKEFLYLGIRIYFFFIKIIFFYYYSIKCKQHFFGNQYKFQMHLIMLIYGLLAFSKYAVKTSA